MRLILARHGNTFAPGDKIVWVGRGQDLPLVHKGEDQARSLVHALSTAEIMPAAVYCGPLRRTRRYAEILIEGLNLDQPPVVDERLSEIDYGAWGGLTSEEIIERFGKDELAAWQDHSQWPESGDWRPGESEVVAAVSDLTAEIVGEYGSGVTVVVVTSNGVLRYFLKQVPGRFEQQLYDGSVKVSTGHVCELEHEQSRLRVVSWNLDPRGGFA